MTILRSYFHALGGGPASISASWSGLSGTIGVPTVSNEDRTITFGGGSRTVTRSGGGPGVTWEYRINSGAWTTYSGGFSLSSGQTLAWRATYTVNVVGSTVTVAINGVTLTTFSSDASGF